MIARRLALAGGAEELLQAAGRALSTTPAALASRRPRRAPAPAPSPAAASDTSPQAPPLAQQQQQQTQPVPVGQEWTEVVHPQTGLTYYWNQRTGETTAVGEPRPGPEGRLQHYRAPPAGVGAAQAARSGAAGLGQLVAMGAGVGLVFALLARVF